MPKNKTLSESEINRIKDLLTNLKKLYARMTPPLRANVLETTGYDLAMEALEIEKMIN